MCITCSLIPCIISNSFHRVSSTWGGRSIAAGLHRTRREDPSLAFANHAAASMGCSGPRLFLCLSVCLSFCLPVSYSRTLRLLFKGQEQDLLRIANMERAAITEVYSLDIPAGLFQFLIELSAIIAARPSPPDISIFCSKKIFTMRSE